MCSAIDADREGLEEFLVDDDGEGGGDAEVDDESVEG